MSDSVPSINSHPELTPEKAKALHTIASHAGGRSEEITASNVAANIEKIKQDRAGMPAAAAQAMRGHRAIGPDIIGDLDLIAYRNGVIPDNVKDASATLVQGSGMSAARAKELVTEMALAEKEIGSSLHTFGIDREALAEGNKRFRDATSELRSAIQVAFDSDVKKHLDVQDAKVGHIVTPPAGSGRPGLNEKTPHKSR